MDTPLTHLSHLTGVPSSSPDKSSQVPENAARRAVRILTLSLICVAAFCIRLFSVIKFESIIHEFDPWFNYRATEKLINVGFYEFWNWFDDLSWYPLGRAVGPTLYPGLMITGACLHRLLHLIGLPVSIKDICVFMGPAFAGLTSLAMYKLASEIKDRKAGLLAAAFIGIVPGYISRSVAGSYDNECIAIFILTMTMWLWLRAVRTGSPSYAALAAASYFYMVSAWGGYAFLTNLIPLHVLTLTLLGKFDGKLYASYCSYFVIGTLLSMHIPFVRFLPVTANDHMAAIGVFGLLQLVAFSSLLKTLVSQKKFRVLLNVAAVTIFGLMAMLLLVLRWLGVVGGWGGRFYSLWDPSYARKHMPIIASVSEHQPTSWGTLFLDLQILIVLLPAGMYFCIKHLRPGHVLVIVYSVTATYFAGVMVRLILTLAPVVAVSGGITFSYVLDSQFGGISDDGQASEDQKEAKSPNAPKKRLGSSGSRISKPRPIERLARTNQNHKLSYGVVVLLMYVFALFVIHCVWVARNVYSSPSVVLSSQTAQGEMIIDDFREAYYWLRKNTDQDARIMSWWDYGYQLAGMSNRTTIVDNNTWNYGHIATVGKALALREDDGDLLKLDPNTMAELARQKIDAGGSYGILNRLGVDYVVVFYGGRLSFSGDDLNKFLWIIRITENEFRSEVEEQSFMSPRTGQYDMSDTGSTFFRNSLMYKTSYHNVLESFNFGDLLNNEMKSREARRKLAAEDEEAKGELSERLLAKLYRRIKEWKEPPRKAQDFARRQHISSKAIDLSTMEEVYTTHRWLVRIYRVREKDPFSRTHKQARAFERSQRSERRPRTVFDGQRLKDRVYSTYSLGV